MSSCVICGVNDHGLECMACGFLCHMKGYNFNETSGAEIARWRLKQVIEIINVIESQDNKRDGDIKYLQGLLKTRSYLISRIEDV